MPVRPRRTAPLALVAVLTLVLANDALPDTAAAQSGALNGAKSWSYGGPTGPAYWGKLDPAWRLCETGTAQTPIIIPASGPANPERLGTRLPARRGVMYNTGYQVKVDLDPGAWIKVGRDSARVLQFHAHTPAEHVRTLANGDTVRPPAEVHLVAQDARGLVVLGSWVEAGENGDAFWNELIDQMPEHPGPRVTIPSVPLAAAFGVTNLDAERIYRYDGSLTTPGCGQGVRWLMREKTIEMQWDAIATLARISGMNARPPQPLRGRPVTVHPPRSGPNLPRR